MLTLHTEWEIAALSDTIYLANSILHEVCINKIDFLIKP